MDLFKWANRKELVEREKCFGCMACYNVCSQKAIVVKRDKFEGIYTEIDKRKCVDCGACINVCPALSKMKLERNSVYPKVYAAISKNEGQRLYSTSGGVFPVLASKIISQQGIVAGVAYDKGFQTKNIIVKKKEDLKRIFQSKYIQSTPGMIYKHIKLELGQGKTVLFTGTPCQIEGLYLYLGKDKQYDNLITCEIICIGVPLLGMFRKYLKILSHKYGSEPTRVWFKHKVKGWDQLTTRIYFKNGLIYEKDKNSDLFMLGFRRFNFFVRRSCFNCPFKGVTRHADLTLGDFWGLTRTRFNDNKGISLILVNSEAGERLFERCAPDLDYEKRLLKEAMKNEGLVSVLSDNVSTKLFRLFYGKLPLQFILGIAKKCLS